MTDTRQVDRSFSLSTKFERVSACALTSCVTVFLVAVPSNGPTNAQDNRSATSRGVRHVLKVSLVLPDKSVPLKEPTSKPEMKLRMSVRISDHAPDADFFGVVTADFTGSDLLPPGGEKTVWQARKCHQDRGWPKVTVVGIEGEIFDGQMTAKVSAVPRHIGKLMPADEIIVTKRSSTTSVFNEWAIRAQAKASKVTFDLRLKALQCDL